MLFTIVFYDELKDIIDLIPRALEEIPPDDREDIVGAARSFIDWLLEIHEPKVPAEFVNTPWGPAFHIDPVRPQRQAQCVPDGVSQFVGHRVRLDNIGDGPMAFSLAESLHSEPLAVPRTSKAMKYILHTMPSIPGDSVFWQGKKGMFGPGLLGAPDLSWLAVSCVGGRDVV